METDNRPVKNEALLGCTYIEKDNCAHVGVCQIQTLLKNLEDYRGRRGTSKRKKELLEEAKSKNCKCLPLE
jgi:hypothetical protein